MHTNQILERGKSEEKLTTGHGFISSFFLNKSLNMVPSMYSVGFAWISGILHSAHNIAFGIVFSSFCWHNLELRKTFSSRLLDILFLHIFFLVLFVVYFFFFLKATLYASNVVLFIKDWNCVLPQQIHTHTHTFTPIFQWIYGKREKYVLWWLHSIQWSKTISLCIN